MSRWAGSDEAPWTSARVQASRREVGERLAAHTGAIVVLKGAGTLVVEHRGPGGEAGEGRVRARVNLTGGRALASAGTGDVLAGTIAGLLARGLEPWSAARLGVHLHGLAGDLCAPDGTVALDVADALPRALGPAGRARDPWPALIQG